MFVYFLNRYSHCILICICVYYLYISIFNDKYIMLDVDLNIQGTIGCTPNSVPMVLIGLI